MTIISLDGQNLPRSNKKASDALTDYDVQVCVFGLIYHSNKTFSYCCVVGPRRGSVTGKNHFLLASQTLYCYTGLPALQDVIADLAEDAHSLRQTETANAVDGACGAKRTFRAARGLVKPSKDVDVHGSFNATCAHEATLTGMTVPQHQLKCQNLKDESRVLCWCVCANSSPDVCTGAFSARGHAAHIYLRWWWWRRGTIT